MCTFDKVLFTKLPDKEEFDDVELQKERPPKVATGTRFAPSASGKNGRRRCPCWCKLIFICVALPTTVLFASLAYAYSWAKYAVDELTVSRPDSYPHVDMTDEEYYSVMDRVDGFFVALSHGDTDVEDLVVTQDEQNGVYSVFSDTIGEDVWAMRVAYHKDRMDYDSSVNLESLGLGDRYFVFRESFSLDGATTDREQNMFEFEMDTKSNHEGWFDGPIVFEKFLYLFTSNPDVGKSTLHAFIQKASYFGYEVPQDQIDKGADLFEGVYNLEHESNTDFSPIVDALFFLESLGFLPGFGADSVLEVIRNIGSISIAEGKIIVKPRRHENDNDDYFHFDLDDAYGNMKTSGPSEFNSEWSSVGVGDEIANANVASPLAPYEDKDYEEDKEGNKRE